jgi:hypothetical protein
MLILIRGGGDEGGGRGGGRGIGKETESGSASTERGVSLLREIRAAGCASVTTGIVSSKVFPTIERGGPMDTETFALDGWIVVFVDAQASTAVVIGGAF